MSSREVGSCKPFTQLHSEQNITLGSTKHVKRKQSLGSAQVQDTTWVLSNCSLEG